MRIQRSTIVFFISVPLISIRVLTVLNDTIMLHAVCIGKSSFTEPISWNRLRELLMSRSKFVTRKDYTNGSTCVSSVDRDF